MYSAYNVNDITCTVHTMYNDMYKYTNLFLCQKCLFFLCHAIESGVSLHSQQHREEDNTKSSDFFTISLHVYIHYIMQVQNGSR